MTPDLLTTLSKIFEENAEAPYRPVSSDNTNFKIKNPAQKFEGELNSAGLAIANWKLRLAGYNYVGQPFHLINQVNPIQVDNRIEYNHSNGLVEWYTNTEQGLEQGFTLAKPLAGAEGGGSDQLELNIDLAGTGVLQVEDDAGWVSLGNGQRYGGLIAWDANHQPLANRLVSEGNRLKLAIAVKGAVYPITIDPYVQQQKLTASDGANNDQYGWSVALSSDGNTALVGAKSNGNRGAVYVLTRSGVAWTLQQKLTASNGANGDEFGSSVALSSDGNTALIGAPSRSNYKGAAYVFTRSSGTWTEQKFLEPGDPSNYATFGCSVALNGDASIAIIGSYGKNNNQGAAYVFTGGGSTWNQQQKLTESSPADLNYFGYSVTVSRDGTTVLVGAYGVNSSRGLAYVFTISGSTWSQQTTLTRSNPNVNDAFGNSVALSDDGNVALVGAFNNARSAYIYTRSTTTWSQPQVLTANDTNPLQFGFSVALSSDGSTALISAPLSDIKGAAYIFTLSGGVWSQKTKLAADDAASADYFGYSVALSSDGNTALAGAYHKNNSQGAAYVFAQVAPQVSLSSSLNPSILGQSVTFTATVSGTQGTPTGTVTFSVDNSALAPVVVDNTGQAFLSTSGLDAGQHSIKISYSGDSTYSQGNQPELTQTVVEEVDHLIVVNYPSPSTAGTSHNFTVTAAATSGNTVLGYTGTVHFTSTDPQAVLPGDVTLTNGTGSFSATFKTAGSQTLTATDTVTSSITGSQADIVVEPTAATSLNVAGFPSPTNAGVSHPFTVTVLDEFNNVATGYTGTVHFTSTDSQAVLPADATLTNGTGSFSATLKTTGLYSLIATDTVTSSISGTQANILVQPGGGTTLTVAGFPSPTDAGVSHSFSVTATDSLGNIDTTYAGIIHFTSSDPKAVLPGDVTLTNGTGSFSATFKTAGSQTLTATDTVTSSITGSQADIVVEPTAATSLNVAGFPTPVKVETSHNFTVTALDEFNNVATGYTGTVHFTSTDSQAVLPADAVLIAGVGTFPATFKTLGNQSLTATSTLNASLTGSQSGIKVVAGDGARLTIDGYPYTTKPGESHSFTITILDGLDNIAKGYTGTIHFTSVDPDAVLPANYTFTAGDNGVHTFQAIFKTPGPVSLTATDTVNTIISGSLETTVVVTLKKAVNEPPADLIGQLRDSPDRVASNDTQNPISYTFTVKNVGKGKADGVNLKLPVDPQLVLGYTIFADKRVWISSINPGFLTITLPAIEANEIVSGTLIFRPDPDNKPVVASVVSSRYTVSWTNPTGDNQSVNSNAISFIFGDENSNLDVSGGQIQLMTLNKPATGSKVSFHSDFWIPDEQVSAWLTKPDGTSVALVEGKADAQGNFDIIVDTSGLAVGSYVIAAYGQRSQEDGSGVLLVDSSGSTQAGSANALTLKFLGNRNMTIGQTGYVLLP